jgi:myo-inositol-1(or 4)-monophosphatase
MLAAADRLDLEARATLAVALARRVGREANAFRERMGPRGLNVENKGLQHFVTVADRQAEETIRGAVADAFPEESFIGEEGGGASARGGVWVVDPIDGTTNFIRGFRHWGVSMAFVVAGQIEVGAIYDAAVDKVYSAVRRQGAKKDGRSIHVSAVTDPARAIAILGHSRRTDFDAYLAVARRLYGMGTDYRRMGAAAIGLVRVADGIADLYYERHLNGWDMLAGALIAREAGAHVYMPPVEAAISEGGPIVVVSPGLDAAFGFLREGLGESIRVL